MSAQSNRKQWIDIAKGIGIVAVVLGHSGSGNHYISHYLYWFHMPLFFIIAGYLHKQPDSWAMFAQRTRKKTVCLLVPYVAFYLTLLPVYKIVSGLPLVITLADLKRLILGGQMFGSLFAPFWFITVLYLSQVTFSLLLLKVKDSKKLAAILAVSYILAYLDSLYTQTVYDYKVMWNADVVLLAVVYYGAGYLLRSHNGTGRPSLVWGSLLITFLAVVLDAADLINYSLNMRSGRYNHFLLDFLIPVSICILIMLLSRNLEGLCLGKYLAQAGLNSLSIMYLHLTVNVIWDLFFSRNYIVVTILGLIFPILISKLIFVKHHSTRVISQLGSK